MYLDDPIGFGKEFGVTAYSVSGDITFFDRSSNIHESVKLAISLVKDCGFLTADVISDRDEVVFSYDGMTMSGLVMSPEGRII